MYEVNLRVSPDRLLDWDAPLSQQPQAVREAIEGLPYGQRALRVPHQTGAMRVLEDFASQQGLREGADTRGYGYGARRATEDLRNAGVQGVQYLDGGSRAAGEGSRNYVIFNDELIDILRRYGLLGMLGGGAAATAGDEDG